MNFIVLPQGFSSRKYNGYVTVTSSLKHDLCIYLLIKESERKSTKFFSNPDTYLIELFTVLTKCIRPITYTFFLQILWQNFKELFKSFYASSI